MSRAHEIARNMRAGAHLDCAECMELISAAESLLDKAIADQRYADKHGLQEDHCVEMYEGILAKLKKGAGEL
jgi:hypothetical protein